MPQILLFAEEVDKECRDEISAKAIDVQRIAELVTCVKQKRFQKLPKVFIASKSDDVHFVSWWIWSQCYCN